MEQEKETTGNFAEFRAILLQDYFAAKENWEKFGDVTKDNVKENFRVYDRMMELETEIHRLDCAHVEMQLGNVIPPLIVKLWNEVLSHSRAWKEQEMVKMEDLRKKGVSYQERLKLVNVGRLERFMRFDNGKDVTLADIEIVPVSGWLEPITGYDRLKELGITEYTKRNLHKMFKTKPQKSH